ncbi:hypothetical protein [Streptomyces sp. TRM68367]|uniref:hypothetical protein n=1 Tax=Streptomyces sp. TRM68367 TaxID=2758415 RepID=UPI0021CEA2C0|nr:hypothetical protein [Streptomyces sp. TRM68367]
MRLLQLRTLTGIHLTLVCHRPHLPAALHQALQAADHTITTDLQTARRHYYGATAAEPLPTDQPARTGSRWLTLPVTAPPPAPPRAGRRRSSGGTARRPRPSPRTLPSKSPIASMG